MKPISLYFHVPFCRSRCGYCGFYSGCPLTLREPYTTALVQAVETAPLEDHEIQTVYFGGGTPTLLGMGLIAVLEAVRRRRSVAADVEITVEANPGTVTLKLLEELREAGFNRISFGLQDCEDEMLRLLGRGHTAAEGEAAVAMAKAAGFQNISADFMLATPGQTPEKAARLAEYGLSLGVPHLSSYLLKIEPGTAFDRMGMAQRCPDEDTAAECYLAYYKVLEQAGLRHYEISNAAQPGYESRHNLKYWSCEEYLGFGAAAASYFGNQRFTVVRDIALYEQRLADGGSYMSEISTEPYDVIAGDYIMLRLRTMEGVSYAQFLRRFKRDLKTVLGGREQRYLESGHMADTGMNLHLTEKGFYVSNYILADLLRCVD